MDNINFVRHINESANAEEEEQYERATKSILFLFAILIIGCFVKQLLKKYDLPYTVGLFIVAAIFGYIVHKSKEILIYQGLTRIPVNIFMQMFLPVLIFKSAYTMDSHFFLRAMVQCLLLAIPGFVMCAALTAGYSKLVWTSYHWNWQTCFIFGCILSATDPVAVVVLLKEAGISPALATLIEGESLLNNGAAIFLFEVLYEGMKNVQTITVSAFTISFIKIGLGAPFLGYVAGLITSWALLQINNDAVLEFTVTCSSAFLSYYAAEQLKMSGVLTLVALGVVVNRHKSSFSPESEETVHRFWEMMAYFANTMIFVTVGILIAQKAIPHMLYTDALLALATYAAVTVFRIVMVLFWSPILRRIGYGLPWKHAVVLIWGGLRGAIGLALALLLSEETMKHKAASQILIQLSMIIILTLVVNALTMKYLLEWLGLNKIPQSRQIAMVHAIVHLRDVAAKSINIHRRGKLLGGANWPWIEKHTYITDPYNVDNELDSNCQFVPHKAVCPKCLAHHNEVATPLAEEMEEMSEEARCHILKALKVCYWKYFEHGLICRDTVDILHSVANEALDQHGKYIDTNRLKNKFMKVSLMIQKLTYCLTNFGDKLGAGSFLAVDQDVVQLYNQKIGIRHWCLSLITSSFWQPVLCLVILTNSVTIIMEMKRVKIIKIAGYDNMLHIIIAVGFLLLYIIEAAIKIIGLGWKLYIKTHYNKFAFFLVISCIIDDILDTANLYFNFVSFDYFSLFRLLRLFRLIELYKMFWRFVARFVSWLNNKASSRLYYSFDLGRGYLVAQMEVMEKINYLVDYKPCNVVPLKESERGTVEIMKVLTQLQAKNRGIVIARKSHIAAIGVLNDLSVTLKGLHENGLLEVVEFEQLKVIIYELKLKIQQSPKFLSDSKSVQDILKEADWLIDARLLETVNKYYVVQDFKPQQCIHEAGQIGYGISIIASGVVKIIGKSSSKKTELLPNTDSFLYFTNKGNFFEYVSTGYTLGLLGSRQTSVFATTAVCESDVQVLHISNATLLKAEANMAPRSLLSYIIWRSISLKIALPILLDQPHYKNAVDKLNRKLQNCILPDLKTAQSFSTDELVEDIVLIQGRVRDSEAGELYVGPCYIPNTVRRMLFHDQPDFRPRVVLVIIAADRYCLPPGFNWSGFAFSPFSAEMKPSSSTAPAMSSK